MSAREFPKPGQSATEAGLTSKIAPHRAGVVVLRNNRIVCWLMMGLGICSLFLGICMMLMVVSLLFPVSALSFMRIFAAVQWGLGGLAMSAMCPPLWKWGLRMMHSSVKLDELGVEFNLGTKRQPQDLFMAWEQVASVGQKRVGNAQEFTVLGRDGGRAIFNSYTFFRSKHVARTIAKRAGLTVQRT